MILSPNGSSPRRQVPDARLGIAAISENSIMIQPAEHRTRRLLSWDALESRQLLTGLTYTITSNQQVYLPGQPVQSTLTETNNTSAPISFGVGPG